MKLYDFLKMVDLNPLPIRVLAYNDDEEDEYYCGQDYETPFWVLDCELNPIGEHGAAVEYVILGGESKYKDQHGLIIYVK